MQRFHALDLLRTTAITCMTIYHAAFDLSRFYEWDIDVFSPSWLAFARGTATLFLLLSGASAAISLDRMRTLDPHRRLRKHLLRFARIGGAALLVSVATYAIDPATYVRFGILHLIATAGLLLPLAVPLKERAALLGIGLIGIGLPLRMLRADTALLLPFGVPPAGFRTVDYFPLLPWLGVMLIGYAIGYRFYVRALKRGNVGTFKPVNMPTILLWPGRHSLLLYLLHQPLIMAVLWLLFGPPAV